MKMITLLLGVAISVAVVVAVIVLLTQISKRAKMQVDELQKTRQCLERMETPVQTTLPAEEKMAESEPVISGESQDVKTDLKIEDKDAREESGQETGASPYNTGLSGKIYTKEELELLIRE